MPRLGRRGHTTYPMKNMTTIATPSTPIQATTTPRYLAVAADFSLPATCGPVAWAGGRWPHQDWRDGELVSVAWSTASALDASAAIDAHDAGDGEGVAWR